MSNARPHVHSTVCRSLCSASLTLAALFFPPGLLSVRTVGAPPSVGARMASYRSQSTSARSQVPIKCYHKCRGRRALARAVPGAVLGETSAPLDAAGHGVQHRVIPHRAPRVPGAGAKADVQRQQVLLARVAEAGLCRGRGGVKDREGLCLGGASSEAGQGLRGPGQPGTRLPAHAAAAAAAATRTGSLVPGRQRCRALLPATTLVAGHAPQPAIEALAALQDLCPLESGGGGGEGGAWLRAAHRRRHSCGVACTRGDPSWQPTLLSGRGRCKEGLHIMEAASKGGWTVVTITAVPGATRHNRQPAMARLKPLPMSSTPSSRSGASALPVFEGVKWLAHRRAS